MLGIAQARDTAAINAMMRSEVAKGILPADLVLAWSVKPLTEQGTPKTIGEVDYADLEQLRDLDERNYRENVDRYRARV